MDSSRSRTVRTAQAPRAGPPRQKEKEEVPPVTIFLRARASLWHRVAGTRIPSVLCQGWWVGRNGLHPKAPGANKHGYGRDTCVAQFHATLVGRCRSRGGGEGSREGRGREGGVLP